MQRARFVALSRECAFVWVFRGPRCLVARQCERASAARLFARVVVAARLCGYIVVVARLCEGVATAALLCAHALVSARSRLLALSACDLQSVELACVVVGCADRTG